jgi:HEAT repeat protein
VNDNIYSKIKELLSGTKPEELKKGLKLVKQEISRIGSDKARPIFEVVSTIFHIDPLDRPDLVPIIDEAISLVVGFGDWVIPVLIHELEGSDLKVQMAIAQALGRIGADAIIPLIEEYQETSDPVRREFILYSLSKIKSPKIVKAGEFAIESAQSSNRELRDTATRAIGKFVEVIPTSNLTEEMRRGFVEVLQKNLADENPGIRAKAIRSLGKLARYGHLTNKEKEKLKITLNLLLGEDNKHEWDRAYLVRKEAKEALQYVV